MFYVYRCVKCAGYWASQAKPGKYRFITKFCPGCLSRMPSIREETPHDATV